ncbi:MAG: hypothetical protein JOY58_03495 [Solirubrobacterales bacterium]|nr:hypothetical protein [Solirubrobacterales bacterium]MBV9047305.1 hypothetical protein [Solirubrobacterales bacterium]
MSESPRLPRSVRHGPPITITCDCGARRDVRYGERWRCEQCERVWDTNQIPIDQYAAIRRDALRALIVPVTVSLLVLAAAVFLIVSGRAVGAIVIVPFVAYLYSQFVRPARRRRRREQLANLPKWEIKPE